MPEVECANHPHSQESAREKLKNEKRKRLYVLCECACMKEKRNVRTYVCVYASVVCLCGLSNCRVDSANMRFNYPLGYLRFGNGR